MFEINLVPDIKDEAIKAIKLRNLIFFICIVVVGACVGILAILGTIKGGQDLALAGKDNRLSELSVQINDFEDIEQLLTMQAQLNQISALNERKTTLSRIFNVMDTLLPTNGDVITISTLNVNLNENMLSFDAQAQAKTEPFINFNVLNAFKQSMDLMRYDYGRYVDENGNNIPTLCVKEKVREDGSVVALWARGATGCDPSNNEEGAAADNDEAQTIFALAAAEPEVAEKKETSAIPEENGDDTDDKDEKKDEKDEDGEEAAKPEEKVVWTTIYRTPQFNEWYKKGHMTTDGAISGVQHFESACVSYNGIEEEGKKEGEVSAKWSSTNDCRLVPSEIQITDASDGRDVDGDLVLRFSALVSIEPEVFLYKNKHMLAIAPTGKIDVTDSYVQVEGMFEERAKDCHDAECNNSYGEL